MEYLGTAAQITIILSFFGAVFSFMILRPLQSSMTELKSSIDKLSSKFEKADERHRSLEVRVEGIDQRARSAHHRLDTISKIIDSKERKPGG